MKKYLNTIFAGLIFFNVAITKLDTLITSTRLDTSITSLEKKVKIIKTVGDFDRNGTKEEAVVDDKLGRINITNLPSINGINECDSLFVIPKGKKDLLGIHYKDGKMEKAEYYPEDESWSTMSYKK